MALTSPDVKDYVMTSLGYPIVKIELDATHYTLSQDRALRDFNRYRPNEQITAHTCPSGVTIVDFIADTLGVLWVDFSNDEQALDGLSIESAMLSNPWAFISTGTPSVDVFSYELQRHWLETLKRSFGNLPEYHIDETKIWLYTPTPSKASITWAMPVTDVANILESYEQLYLDLVLAKARQILGQVRNKFSGVPGAGGVVQLDGQYQINRGEQDEKELIGEIRSIGGQIIPQMS